MRDTAVPDIDHRASPEHLYDGHGFRGHVKRLDYLEGHWLSLLHYASHGFFRRATTHEDPITVIREALEGGR